MKTFTNTAANSSEGVLAEQAGRQNEPRPGFTIVTLPEAMVNWLHQDWFANQHFAARMVRGNYFLSIDRKEHYWRGEMPTELVSEMAAYIQSKREAADD